MMQVNASSKGDGRRSGGERRRRGGEVKRRGREMEAEEVSAHGWTSTPASPTALRGQIFRF